MADERPTQSAQTTGDNSPAINIAVVLQTLARPWVIVAIIALALIGGATFWSIEKAREEGRQQSGKVTEQLAFQATTQRRLERLVTDAAGSGASAVRAIADIRDLLRPSNSDIDTIPAEQLPGLVRRAFAELEKPTTPSPADLSEGIRREIAQYRARINLARNGWEITEFNDPYIGLKLREQVPRRSFQEMLEASTVDLRQLSGQIRSIDISNQLGDISNIQPLFYLVAIQNLRLDWTGIRDVEGLGRMTTITTLSLQENKELHSIEPLQDLKNLTDLDLRWTPVSSVESLRGLTSLRRLNLGATHVIDVRPLSLLVNLEWLNLEETLVENLDALKDLPRLKKLCVSGPYFDSARLNRLRSYRQERGLPDTPWCLR